MPYQYEYYKSLKQYSMTIDLDMVGKDENFDQEANNEEKARRVNALLMAIENLHLVVKGNLDNAEPLFVVGGLVDRKTHYFENVVRVEKGKLSLNDELKDRIANGCAVGLLSGQAFANENAVVEQLAPVSVTTFFNQLRGQVNAYYGV